MHSMTAYNPFAPEVKASPYPFYEWLRQEQPVYYNQEHDFWALSRYQDGSDRQVMLAGNGGFATR